MTEIQIQTWGDDTLEPEEVDEREPTVEELQADLKAAHFILRRIIGMQPHLIPGGPNNKNFGLKGVVALRQAQELAKVALLEHAQREAERDYAYLMAEHETESSDANRD
jgi:hypothetical protein